MAMVVIGLVVAGGSYWFAWFVGLFMVVLPSKKERERDRERERWKKREKIKKNNKEIIFKLRGKKNRITDVGCFVK